MGSVCMAQAAARRSSAEICRGSDVTRKPRDVAWLPPPFSFRPRFSSSFAGHAPSKKFAKKFALGRFEPAEGNLPSRDSFPQTSARARRVSPPARTLGSAFAPRLAPHERAR